MSAAAPVTLASVCEFIVDCLHATAPIEASGYPLIRTPNIGKGRLVLTDVYRVSDQTYEIWTRRATPLPGDLILAREAPAGNVALIRDGETVCLGQRTVHIRPDPRKADPAFLCYFLLAPQQQGRLLASETGATAKHVNMKDIRALDVTGLPPVEAQRAAGAVLAAYDDLIEINRRRIALLEDAARQLFREWFVRLRFPGHEHTKNSQGVPEGWMLRTLADCVTFRSGGTPAKSRPEFWEGDIPWVSSGEMAETRVYDTSLHISEDGVAAGSRLVSANTILTVVRGMSLAKEFRIAMVARAMAFNQDLKALECREGVSPLFLFHSLLDRRDMIRDLAGEAAHGTKKLETTVLERLPVLLPREHLQRLFVEAVEPMVAQRDNLHQQNVRLQTARDLLLPRLMSGAITV